MEKTLKDANKSLLKKREANRKGKKDVLQLILSKIEEGKIREARRMALMHPYGEYQKDLVEMFKKAEKGLIRCQQCKGEFQARFNPIFLKYDSHLNTCPDCELKIAHAASVQKNIDRAEAFNQFKSEHKMLIDVMRQKSGVPFVFRYANKDNLGKAMADALRIDQSYFITGDVGVGKSHIAAALIRMYIDVIVPQYDEDKKKFFINLERIDLPVFIEVPELLLRIKDTYNDSTAETEKDIVDYYTQTPYLVLDDLGSEKASDFSTLMLYLIINRRFTSGKATVITSNLSLIEIQERLSERISSRIKGMCREIAVAGNDKRYEREQKHSND